MDNRQQLNNEIISMEEYLYKRQQIRETEEKRFGKSAGHKEKSSVRLLAELYV